MTSVPFLVEDEPIGIVLRTGQQFARPAAIWAYCWCADEAEDGIQPHQRLPVDRMARS